MQGVYLLHFDKPYCHARHYIGYADNIALRIDAHRRGYGAKLTRAVVAAGIGIQLARTWEGGDRNFERTLHNRNNTAALCPLCNPDALKNAAEVQTPAISGRHECVPFGRKFMCLCCDMVLTARETGHYCTGKGYYASWAKVPDALKTREQWAKIGLMVKHGERAKAHVLSAYNPQKERRWIDLFEARQMEVGKPS